MSEKAYLTRVKRDFTMLFKSAILRSLIITIGAFSVSLGDGNPAAAQVTPFQRFRNALVDYFAVLNFVPILVDRGYRAGDVIEADGVNLMARSAQCFPTLQDPAPVPTSLPSTVETTAAELSFGLRLKQIFSSSAGVDLVKNIRLSFGEVTVVAVTRFDLKQTLDRKACGDIAAIVDGTTTPVDRNWKPRFVIAEVMSGTREATLTFTDKANLQAKAEKIAQTLGNADLTVTAGADGTLTLKSNQKSIIAVKPVTIPEVKLSTVADSLRGSGELELKWNPTECETPQSCKRLFDPFADLLKASTPKFDPGETDK